MEVGRISEKLTKVELELLEKVGYSNKAIELYKNKVNVGVMENADVALSHTGECGDIIKMYLKIDKNEIIEDAKFQYTGCMGAATSGSAVTKLAKSRTVEEASKITRNDVLKELGDLPKSKFDCMELALTTLRRTIGKYEKNKRQQR